MAVMVGERVYLRPLERTDVDGGWLDWVNDHGLSQYLGGSFPVTREALLQYYDASQPPGTTMFAICLNENDKYICNARLSEIDSDTQALQVRASNRRDGVQDARLRERGVGPAPAIRIPPHGHESNLLRSLRRQRDIPCQQREGGHEAGGHHARRAVQGRAVSRHGDAGDAALGVRRAVRLLGALTGLFTG